MSFGVAPGEIFGLLGPNGAGKSTTFNIATAMISRSSGDVKLKNVDIDDSNLEKIFTEVGICPQFDALWEELAIDEHIYIFAKIKCIGRYDIHKCLLYILNQFKLYDHMKKKVKNLSGGMKRKLCTGISLLGGPSLQFLDEPSTGLDPMAKRNLWDMLHKTVMTRKASTILSTHSMEEAEALCHKIGIVVNGRFVCLGPLEYLKNKYGSGYKISIAKTEMDLKISDLMNNIFVMA